VWVLQPFLDLLFAHFGSLGIDFSDLHVFLPSSHENAVKRGGKKETVSEEARIQSQRELNTLSALYNSPAAIPYSPQEPDSGNDGSQEPDNLPTIIPLPDHLKVSVAPWCERTFLPATICAHQNRDLTYLHCSRCSKLHSNLQITSWLNYKLLVWPNSSRRR
jgi:hypothetical protein